MTNDRGRPSRRDFLKQGAVALAGASTIPTGVSWP